MNRSRLASAILPYGLGLLTLAAWSIYAVGLLAPLTPSEGTPTPQNLVLYAGCPAILLVIVTRNSTNSALRFNPTWW